MTKVAKIITVSSVKGGIGKSSILLNYGAYEANQHKHVLFIDLDAQCNTTSMFTSRVKDKSALKNSSIIRAIKHDAKNTSAPFPKDFEPAHITKYIDVIAGSNETKNLEEIMHQRKAMSPYIVFHVITALDLLHKYDYILIDTHNSFQLPTINGLIVSDYILSPVIPNRFSYQAMISMTKQMKALRDEYFDVKTGKSDIDAKMYFIGNMLSNNKATKDFLKATKGLPTFIANLKKRELINKAINDAKSVYSYAKNSNDRKIIQKDISPVFKQIDKVINRK